MKKNVLLGIMFALTVNNIMCADGSTDKGNVVHNFLSGNAKYVSVASAAGVGYLADKVACEKSLTPETWQRVAWSAVAMGATYWSLRNGVPFLCSSKESAK